MNCNRHWWLENSITQRKKTTCFVVRNSLLNLILLLMPTMFILFSLSTNVLAQSSSITPTVPTTVTLSSTLSTTTAAPISQMGQNLSTPTSTLTLPNVTYLELIQHFERVSSLAFYLINFVIVLLGLAGAGAVFFGINKFSDIDKYKRLTDEQEQELEELRREKQFAAQYLRYLYDIRSKHSEVRIRAIQRLGYSRDISVVPILSEVLQIDEDIEVRLETAIMLSILLRDLGDIDAREPALETLIDLVNAKNNDEKIRSACLDAFGTIFSANSIVPRSIIYPLERLAKDQGELENLRVKAEQLLARWNNSSAAATNA